jgi:N-ethylmaleimide reductase
MATNIFSTIKIGALELKNRIAMAPMTRARSQNDGIPKQWNADYYAQRGKL